MQMKTSPSRVVGDDLVLGVTKDRGAHPIGQHTRIKVLKIITL